MLNMLPFRKRNWKYLCFTEEKIFTFCIIFFMDLNFIRVSNFDKTLLKYLAKLQFWYKFYIFSFLCDRPGQEWLVTVHMHMPTQTIFTLDMQLSPVLFLITSILGVGLLHAWQLLRSRSHVQIKTFNKNLYSFLIFMFPQ